jgi:hypothetical protein
MRLTGGGKVVPPRPSKWRSKSRVGPQEPAPRPSALNQAGWRSLSRLQPVGRQWNLNSAGRVDGKSASRHDIRTNLLGRCRGSRNGRGRRDIRPRPPARPANRARVRSIAVDQLDQPPTGGSRSSRSVWTPQEGRSSRPPGGCAGALPSFSDGRSRTPRETPAAHRAKPRPGCWPPRRGLASLRRWGRGGERRTGAHGGLCRSRSNSLVRPSSGRARSFRRRRLRVRASQPRAVAALPVSAPLAMLSPPKKLTCPPPLLRRRLSRRTRVGRASRVPLPYFARGARAETGAPEQTAKCARFAARAFQNGIHRSACVRALGSEGASSP